jgi:putative PIN family toxin of toxin-antitoxin system
VIAAVLDANVLASGLVNLAKPESPLGALLRAWAAGAFTVLVSDHILDEVERALQKPYFQRRMTPQQIAAGMQAVRRQADIIVITAHVQDVATHREDDLVLATAVSADANYLVTGDKDLLALGSYQGVTIVSPRQFLHLLDQA